MVRKVKSLEETAQELRKTKQVYGSVTPTTITEKTPGRKKSITIEAKKAYGPMRMKKKVKKPS